MSEDASREQSSHPVAVCSKFQIASTLELSRRLGDEVHARPDRSEEQFDLEMEPVTLAEKSAKPWSHKDVMRELDIPDFQAHGSSQSFQGMYL